MRLVFRALPATGNRAGDGLKECGVEFLGFLLRRVFALVGGRDFKVRLGFACLVLGEDARALFAKEDLQRERERVMSPRERSVQGGMA